MKAVRRGMNYILVLILAFALVHLSTYGWVLTKSFDFASGVDQGLVGRLKSDVFYLSSELGDRNADIRYEQLLDAEKFISNRLQELGYDVQYQEYKVFGKPTRNIIAERKGVSSGNEIYVIGAHYDSCYNPGANDNASAVAVLLELAARFANENINKTLRFVAFVNEEPPYFKTSSMGSLVYAKSLKQKNENVKGMIALDCLGYYSNKPFSQKYPPFLGYVYPNRGNFITVVSDFKSSKLNKKISLGLKKSKSIPSRKLIASEFINAITFSDHWSFWQQGYPAVMVTDTAFLRGNTYHQQNDTYEKINYNALSKLVAGLTDSIQILVNTN